MSRVCSIHEEFCPDDVCRWCESPPAEPERLGLMQAIPDTIWNHHMPLIVHYGNCSSMRGVGNACDCATIARSHT